MYISKKFDRFKKLLDSDIKKNSFLDTLKELNTKDSDKLLSMKLNFRKLMSTSKSLKILSTNREEMKHNNVY